MANDSDIAVHEAGFCGDFCGKCPNYQNGCRGCVPQDHGNCYFVRCCLERDIEHCGLCVDFPCEKLSAFVPDDRPGCPAGYHIMNLRARLTVGTKTWLQGQKGDWKGKTRQ